MRPRRSSDLNKTHPSCLVCGEEVDMQFRTAKPKPMSKLVHLTASVLHWSTGYSWKYTIWYATLAVRTRQWQETRGESEGKWKCVCLCVSQPIALSSLILNHEAIVHDTLLCSAQIWLFTVSTEIWQARLLSLNSLGQMGVCHNLFLSFFPPLFSSPSSPFHSANPPSTPHFVANLPALPVQIDKFNQLQKNKWKRENEACEGDNLCWGERCGWLACRQVTAWQTLRIMEIVSELKEPRNGAIQNRRT